MFVLPHFLSTYRQMCAIW
uniref:Uncharacterized protein n=1 Tax=Arundo donax TaxID=35708 RepID=A0A0A9FWR9_ARUDO